MATDSVINEQQQDLSGSRLGKIPNLDPQRIAASDTGKRPARKRTRKWSPNGRNYKRLAGDAPLFVRWDDGTVEKLTQEERAMINFTRSLPEDLRKEYCNLMEKKGTEFDSAIAAFKVHYQARRGEIAWPPTV